MKKKHQSQQDDAMAADILNLTELGSTSGVEAPPRSKASKSYSSKNEKDAPKKKKKKNNHTSKNTSKSKSQSVQSSYLSNAKMLYAAPTTPGGDSNSQPLATSASSSDTLNTNKQHRNNSGNPPSLVSQPNYQRPGAYQVNGTRRQDDSDDDSSWNSENDGSVNQEAFVQEGQAQHNNAHHENDTRPDHRRPPIQTAIPMEEGTHAGKEDTDWCSFRNIIIAASVTAVVILVVTVVVILVLMQSGGSDDAPPGSSRPTPAPYNDNDLSPTSAPSASRTGILPYMIDDINLDDYPFIALYAVQYGFDVTAFEENGVPLIEFSCPQGEAIVLANTPIHYNDQGKVVTDINPIACEVTGLIEIGCSYKNELLHGISSTIFIVGCVSETGDSASTTLDIFAEKISSAVFTPTPSFVMQSMSFGQFCIGDDLFAGGLLFSPGDYLCTGVDNGFLHICGAFSSCSVSTICSLDKVKVVTTPNTACTISRNDSGGTFDGLWNNMGSLKQALDTSFVFPQFTQDSLAILTNPPLLP